MRSSAVFISVSCSGTDVVYVNSYDDPTASSVMAHRHKAKKAKTESTPDRTPVSQTPEDFEASNGIVTAGISSKDGVESTSSSLPS